jgi:hypothetical protein
LIGYGVLWLAEAGLIAIVIRLQVSTPAELLRDVATRPVIWIGASVVLSVQQVLLVVVVPALGRVVGPSTVAADDGGRRIGSMAAGGGTGHRGRRRLVRRLQPAPVRLVRRSRLRRVRRARHSAAGAVVRRNRPHSLARARVTTHR